ncbi:hypothetical protein BJY04DRAFT_179841 [Aspergillus karnatakaensis]|uniref:uncharacterized protein n=1 Tax=Aspergillus karnatakaensis TaxID=1810916 RepID=UPI003CCC9854
MIVITVIISLCVCAHSFQIDFWGGKRCRSTPLGEYHHAFNDDFPCYKIPINSESATVTNAGGADKYTSLRFYESDDRSGESIASSNSGCIDFTATSGNALSYDIQPDGLNERNVTNSLARQAKSARRAASSASTHWTIRQQEAREGLDSSRWTGSLSPDWDPYAGRGEGAGHGDETILDGKTWKWQQIALGIFVGIPKAEWNDDIHTRDDRFVAWTTNPEDFAYADTDAVRGNQTLHAGPSWNYAQCRALISCARHYLDDAFRLNNGWAQTVRAIQRVIPSRQRMYDYLHEHPYRVSITITTASTLAGFGLGYTQGGATAQDNDQLGNCAGTANQADAFIAAFLQNGGGDGSTAEVNITLPDGHILSISAVVYEQFGEPASGFTCGIDD